MIRANCDAIYDAIAQCNAQLKKVTEQLRINSEQGWRPSHWYVAGQANYNNKE